MFNSDVSYLWLLVCCTISVCVRCDLFGFADCAGLALLTMMFD